MLLHKLRQSVKRGRFHWIVSLLTTVLESPDLVVRLIEIPRVTVLKAPQLYGVVYATP